MQPRRVDPTSRSGHRPGLRRQDHLVTDLELLEQFAEQRLGAAVGVDIGSIDERAARVEERRQLVPGVVLVGAPGPRSGAEREPADPHTGTSQRPAVHAGTVPRAPRATP